MAWAMLLSIKASHWWEEVTEVDTDTGEIVQKWRRFDDYVADFYSRFKQIRRRTAQTRIDLAEKLTQGLGVNPRNLYALMEDKPTLTARTLDTVAEFDDMGEFIGVNPQVRARVLDELGLDDALTDKEVIDQVLARVAEGEHDDVSNFLDTLSPEPKVWWRFDPVRNMVIFYKKIRKGTRVIRSENHFRLKDDTLDKDIKNALMQRRI